ncbi:hypothetical protein [Granulicella tundricola]|uniref:hypothetical protein n=1 Tax=Granulicella tundricola TaxID=940615 RepID=UPI0018DB3144|nr:hypothetical protein [Granulicella tundricola]
MTAAMVTVPSLAQDAKALRAQANTEPNQEKQVILLCKAADMEPKNKDFRKDCDVSRAALINSDKQALKTALDANDAGQAAKAKRYAKYVSNLDPDTHHQAEQLLAKLNGPGPDAPTTALTKPADQSGALLSQAMTAFDSGNLSAARTAAQGVTDPSIKPAATRLLGEIDRYGSLVSTGHSHEDSKEYAQAERSYQSALDLNGHVGSDDLSGKIQRMHQMAAVAAAPVTQAQAPVVIAKNVPPPPPPVSKPAADQKALNKPPDVSPDEKKRKLLEEASLAVSHKDSETASRKYRQVLDIDPANADAKREIARINAEVAAELSRDPVKLETTLREAITAFYSSHFEDAESRLNRYLGADGGKKKGAAYFYLGATEETLAYLDPAAKRATRQKEAQEDFKQARSAGYQPVAKYVSTRILEDWKNPGL